MFCSETVALGSMQMGGPRDSRNLRDNCSVQSLPIFPEIGGRGRVSSMEKGALLNGGVRWRVGVHHGFSRTS